MNSHAGVATHDNSRYVASTNAYSVNGPHHIYHNPGYVQGQKAAQPRAAVEQPRGPLPHRAQSLAAGTCMPALRRWQPGSSSIARSIVISNHVCAMVLG